MKKHHIEEKKTRALLVRVSKDDLRVSPHQRGATLTYITPAGKVCVWPPNTREPILLEADPSLYQADFSEIETLTLHLLMHR